MPEVIRREYRGSENLPALEIRCGQGRDVEAAVASDVTRQRLTVWSQTLSRRPISLLFGRLPTTGPLPCVASPVRQNPVALLADFPCSTRQAKCRYIMRDSVRAHGGFNSLRVADYFMDASVAGEGALVTYFQI